MIHLRNLKLILQCNILHFKSMKSFVFIPLLFFAIILNAQPGRNRSVLQQVSNKDLVQSVFPEAVKVSKINDYWFSVVDSKGKTLGYALSSEHFCENVIGYQAQTPVMIITTKKFIIKKVALLSHYESPGYVQILERNGFFRLWDEKTFTEAETVKPDAYSGATMTAKAVNENVKFLLDKGYKTKPR